MLFFIRGKGVQLQNLKEFFEIPLQQHFKSSFLLNSTNTEQQESSAKTPKEVEYISEINDPNFPISKIFLSPWTQFQSS